MKKGEMRIVNASDPEAVIFALMDFEEKNFPVWDRRKPSSQIVPLFRMLTRAIEEHTGREMREKHFAAIGEIVMRECAIEWSPM